jgi:NAD(P)-dependent dehydrogenase (short-subunit alcohol dehydrogenase family)
VLQLARAGSRESGPGLEFIEVNANSEASVQDAVISVSQEALEIDLWIYAIGDIQSSKVADLEPDAWIRILNSNLTGAYLAAHYSLPLLADDAPMIFLGAISERLQLPGLSSYAAAKAGLEAFVNSLRKEERQRPITIIRPAAVATSFWEKVPFSMPKNALKPSVLAERIFEAYQAGHTGMLDISTEMQE